MTDTTFFRLLDGADRPARLLDAVRNLREGDETPDVHRADPDSFRQVPGSPFAYWVSEEVRSKFANLSAFEDEERAARVGLQTSDDFRFVRTSWETDRANIASSNADTASKKWVPFAKGGDYSPYYSDVHLLVNWHGDGKEIKAHICNSYPYLKGKWQWVAKNTDFYFRPGLTWPRRTQRGLSVRAYPEGSIFGHKGPVIFAAPDSLAALLAIANSAPFHRLVELQMAFGSYEVGVIQRTPVPNLPEAEAKRLGELALDCVEMKRTLDSANETSHAFHLPALLQTEGASLGERMAEWRDLISESERRLAENQREIDDLAFDLYGISGEDRAAMEGAEDAGEGNGESGNGESGNGESGNGESEEPPEAPAPVEGASLAADLLSYAVGCVFGRWDVRMALDASLAPRLADPFAPLPVCSPGTLVGPDAMPVGVGFRGGEVASEAWMRARHDAITAPERGSVESPAVPQSDHPLEIDRDGILADDPDRPDDDIASRVRCALELLWGEKAEDIEREARETLGTKDLRSYFRNPKKFFDHHVKRYSKSRRKAPIFWLLQSPKKNYGLWIYYHRLDPDLLFKALTRYVEPKIRLEETRLEEHEASLRELTDEGGSEAKRAERAIAGQRDLLADLREFRARLSRAADLSLTPDLDDGVVLNIAPLHEVVAWPEAKTRWNELLSGKHEWSSIARQLREKGVV